MPKNIVEAINELNANHKYAIADAVNNFEGGGSSDGSYILHVYAHDAGGAIVVDSVSDTFDNAFNASYNGYGVCVLHLTITYNGGENMAISTTSIPMRGAFGSETINEEVFTSREINGADTYISYSNYDRKANFYRTLFYWGEGDAIPTLDIEEFNLNYNTSQSV